MDVSEAACMHAYLILLVTASNNRRNVNANPPTPNCTLTAAISNIQAQCADAVSRTSSLLSLASRSARVMPPCGER